MCLRQVQHPPSHPPKKPRRTLKLVTTILNNPLCKCYLLMGRSEVENIPLSNIKYPFYWKVDTRRERRTRFALATKKWNISYGFNKGKGNPSFFFFIHLSIVYVLIEDLFPRVFCFQEGKYWKGLVCLSADASSITLHFFKHPSIGPPTNNVTSFPDPDKTFSPLQRCYPRQNWKESDHEPLLWFSETCVFLLVWLRCILQYGRSFS